MLVKRDDVIAGINRRWVEHEITFIQLQDDKQKQYKHLFAIDRDSNEGHFLIWQDNGTDQTCSLDIQTTMEIVQEAAKAGLQKPFNVYARFELLSGEYERFTQLDSNGRTAWRY